MLNSFPHRVSRDQSPANARTPGFPSLVKAVEIRQGGNSTPQGPNLSAPVGSPRTRSSSLLRSSAGAEAELAVAAAWQGRPRAALPPASPASMTATRFQAPPFTPFWQPGVATTAAYDELCRDGQQSSMQRIAAIIGDVSLTNALCHWTAELSRTSSSPGQADYAGYVRRLVLWVLENLLTVSTLTQDSETLPDRLGCTQIDGGTLESIALGDRRALQSLCEKAAGLGIVQYRLALNEDQTITVFAQYPFRLAQVPRIAFRLSELSHDDLCVLLQELIGRVENLAHAAPLTAAPSVSEKRKALPEDQTHASGGATKRQIFQYSRDAQPVVRCIEGRGVELTGMRTQGVAGVSQPPAPKQTEVRTASGTVASVARQAWDRREQSAVSDGLSAGEDVLLVGSRISVKTMLSGPEPVTLPPLWHRGGAQPTEPQSATIPAPSALRQQLHERPLRPRGSQITGLGSVSVQENRGIQQSPFIHIEGRPVDIESARLDYEQFSGREHCSNNDLYAHLLHLCSSARRAPHQMGPLIRVSSLGENVPAHYFIQYVPGRPIAVIAVIEEVGGTDVFKRAHLLYTPGADDIRRIARQMAQRISRDSKRPCSLFYRR